MPPGPDPPSSHPCVSGLHDKISEGLDEKPFKEVTMANTALHFRFCFVPAILPWVLAAISPTSALAHLPAPPTLEQALSLKPIQSGIDFDRPSAEERKTCKVVSAKEIGQRGWIVQNEAGRLLRRFIDTNADNRLDQWCYYHNGVEVYRDIDSDFDEKADQYRWLGTAGTRWGLDEDEDGTIDRWKSISAEETSAEIVAAVRTGDWKRFRLVLLSEKELGELGVSDTRRKELVQQLKETQAAFEAFTADQSVVTSESEWSYFGGTRPGLIPKGTNGSTKDLIFYDNVIAVVDEAGQHRQLAIGTLIQVGQGWRAVSSPEALVSGQAMKQRSLFMLASTSRVLDNTTETPEGELTREVQDLLLELGKYETALNDASTPASQTEALQAYVATLEKLFKASTTEADKLNWIRQAADSIYLGIQRGTALNGTSELSALADRLDQSKASLDARAYVRYRSIESNYFADSATTNEEYEVKQEKWVKALEQFVVDFADSETASDALRELALIEEFSQDNEKALARYRQIVSDYPNSANAEKAAGAVWRLSSTGKTLNLKANTLQDRAFDLTSLKGKTVVLHSWATWCELCKEEAEELEDLQKLYGSKGLRCVGLNVDIDPSDARSYLATHPLPWPQIHSEGGLESDLANQLGIVSLPVTFLIDENGKVIKQIYSITELKSELRERMK